MEQQLPEQKEKVTNLQKGLVVLIVVLGLLGVYIFVSKSGKNEQSSGGVRNFEDCVAAGNPVMESYPRQCRSGNITFVEDIKNDIEENPVVVPELESDVPVRAPLVVSGRALGTWFFEATFPVKLYDSAGNLLAQAQATALDNWMTTGYVQFTVSLDFTVPGADGGYVVFEKSNPSGLPENAGLVQIPVRFK